MPIEKSAGAIVFRKESFNSVQGKEGEIYYLLLHYLKRSGNSEEYWDLPKGHIEKGEDILNTVKREVFEETGLKDINFIDGFKETIRYFFKFEEKNIMKFVTFYLVETKTKEVEVSEEHIGYKWLSYEESLKQLTYKNARDILKKANEFIIEHGT